MKNIVLIDNTLTGHHLSFLKSFCSILLQQGNKVIVLVPGAEVLAKAMIAEPGFIQDRFHAIDYAEKTFNQYKGKFGDTRNTLARWKYDASLVKGVEQSLKLKVDLVFYAWLDYQLARFIPAFMLDRIFPYKWSGLYFHPYHLRREPHTLQLKASWRDLDSIFLSRNCVGVTIHDSAIQSGFQYRIGKAVIHFPETADDTTPDLSYPLYQQIKEKAKNRIVVGMIGCEKHKGTLTMMRMVKLADKEKFFFLFLGMLPKQTYTETEWKEVEEFIAEQRENCFFSFQSIPEGAAYNAVFCAMHIPFLVYDNFVSSSNRLTKAAIFERLVLASDNYCVGDDVKKYRLGAAVTPCNENEALKGLNELAHQIEHNDYPTEEWKIYKEINSVALLAQRFKEVLNNI